MLTANSLTLCDYLSALPGMLRGRAFQRAALRRELAVCFGVDEARIGLYDTGRAALRVLLQQHGIGAGAEVIVPAYTCVVVPNQIPALAATLRFVDVSADTLNFDWDILAAAIGPATRAVIVPHNFGLPCRVPEALRAAHPQVKFIDDAAHGFASQLDGQWLGSYHDGAFFSFEYSKNLSGGIGGLAIFPSGMAAPQQEWPELSCADEWRLLATLKAHLLTARWPLLGRITMAINRRVGLIYRSADAEVTQGVPHPVRAMPLLSSVLVRRQLAHLSATLAHKQALARRYQQALAALPFIKQWPLPAGAECHWVRYPFALSRPVGNKAAVARRLSQASGLNIGVWFDDVIHPAGSFRHGYVAGSAPQGEQLAATVLNLPMNIALADDARLAGRLDKLLAELRCIEKENIQ
ncbi:DegT/DnrJ/EryC1/StrS family aminotransferase [Aquitalea aquatilis]|uniref:DegT/DnrJ/EryC1/StrS family aminotransferase n=1 Tax=Aquitalea aquatilis TaxID=1537400 RepID=UPI0010BD006A|nr:DegT/DnrJ/EryC1/StrS family aminotransferase [Aquitalea aquatilis]